jgi:hypothetical protein
MTMYATENILYEQDYDARVIRTVNNFGYNILNSETSSVSDVSYRNPLLSAERRSGIYVISSNGRDRRCHFQR